MPRGIPVATVAIGNAQNAGLLAIQILASHQQELLEKVQRYREKFIQVRVGKARKTGSVGLQGILG